MSEPIEHVLGFESAELDDLMARGVAADDVHAVAGAVQLLRQQLDQGFIRGGVNRRGGDFDAQFVTERLADLIGRSSRLQLH